MSSTATSRLRLDKQATGDNPNAWGVRLNAALDLIDESQGLSIVPVAADVTLTSNNFSSDQSRRAVLRLTGAGGFTVTVPAVEKLYLIDNRCAANVTIRTASGVGAVCRPGIRTPVYIDALDATAADPTLDQIKTATANVALGGSKFTGGAPSTLDSDYIQQGQVAAIVSPIAAAAASSASASAGSAGASATSASQSAGSATLSQSWATQLSGEVVTGQGYSARYWSNFSQAWATQASGEVVAGQGFSSKYWAMQAAASASAAATFDPNNFYTKTAADARFAPISGLPILTGNRAISAADTVIASDKGKVLNLSGTFTLGATAAATLGAGFYCWLRKRDGAGVFTFDPNAAETIDGLSLIRIYQESFLIWTDGTAWFSQGRPKGWVPITELVIASSVASADFTLGLNDPEFRDMEFKYNGITPSGSGGFGARVSKGGAFIATSNYATYGAVYNGSGFTASSNFSYLDLSIGNPGGNIVSGRIQIDNFRTATAQNSSAEWTTQWGSSYAFARGYEAANNAAIDGVRFLFVTANITAGTINQRGYRP